MKTRTSIKNILFVMFGIILLTVAAFPTQMPVRAEFPADRSGVASPAGFDEQQTTIIDSTESSILALNSMEALSSSSQSCSAVYQAGGDRLAGLQNNDGGWDWPVDDGDPANISPKNTIGPIGMGLAQVYYHTYDPDHLPALHEAGRFLLAKTNNFSPSDGYLANELDQLFGGATYTDHVKNNFFGPLAAGTYNRNGAGTLYSTTSYVNSIRTSRSGSQANLAAWDIGMGLVAASSVGAETGPWIAGLKTEIDELDGSGWYDVIGLAGAVYGLAYVGEDFNPAAGSHAVAESLSDLAGILKGYQLSTGGFTWNSGYLGEGEGNETVQETAYAILALEEFNKEIYASQIQSAAEYLTSVQLSTGGWEGYVGSGENNEITGEALWGISVALSQSPFASNLLASPNPVAINSTVTVTASVESPSCTGTDSADYLLDNGTWVPMTASDGGFNNAQENVEVTFTAPSSGGLYNLCVRGSDATGNTGAQECIQLVVYDPSGGFVTGGGWVDSPVGAYKLHDLDIPSNVWNQGFETDTPGWLDSNGSWYGTVNRVASGTGGITSSVGAFHAVFEGDAESGPFSRFDGYRSTWPGTWIAEVDVYLNPDWASGTGFDYSVAATGSDGLHQRDFIFHVTKDTSTEKLYVAGSNNTNFAPREDLENINHYEVMYPGWYTFQHVFRDEFGALAVDLNLLDASGNLLFTENRFNAADLIPQEVGGNRYAWFTFINVPGGVAVDEHQLTLPISPTGKATFGFVSKYKKGATVPEGVTEFSFQAGDLNFHSSSYEWLVVNQASSNAQFKGVGTINGMGEYKFMLWAGDHDTGDTFRIRIWEEVDGVEVVVYDNGTDQVVGGGNIIVHSAKK